MKFHGHPTLQAWGLLIKFIDFLLTFYWLNLLTFYWLNLLTFYWLNLLTFYWLNLLQWNYSEIATKFHGRPTLQAWSLLNKFIDFLSIKFIDFLLNKFIDFLSIKFVNFLLNKFIDFLLIKFIDFLSTKFIDFLLIFYWLNLLTFYWLNLLTFYWLFITVKSQWNSTGALPYSHEVYFDEITTYIKFLSIKFIDFLL